MSIRFNVFGVKLSGNSSNRNGFAPNDNNLRRRANAVAQRNRGGVQPSSENLSPERVTQTPERGLLRTIKKVLESVKNFFSGMLYPFVESKDSHSQNTSSPKQKALESIENFMNIFSDPAKEGAQLMRAAKERIANLDNEKSLANWLQGVHNGVEGEDMKQKWNNAPELARRLLISVCDPSNPTFYVRESGSGDVRDMDGRRKAGESLRDACNELHRRSR